MAICCLDLFLVNHSAVAELDGDAVREETDVVPQVLRCVHRSSYNRIVSAIVLKNTGTPT